MKKILAGLLAIAVIAVAIFGVVLFQKFTSSSSSESGNPERADTYKKWSYGIYEQVTETWAGELRLELWLEDDGTFEIDPVIGGVPKTEGTYTIEGNEIIFYTSTGVVVKGIITNDKIIIEGGTIYLRGTWEKKQ